MVIYGEVNHSVLVFYCDLILGYDPKITGIERTNFHLKKFITAHLAEMQTNSLLNIIFSSELFSQHFSPHLFFHFYPYSLFKYIEQNILL